MTAYSVTMQTQSAPHHTMLIEACELGWWYSAPLPHGQRIVSLLTDVDLALSASAGKDAAMSVLETVMPEGRKQRVFRFGLTSSVFVPSVTSPARLTEMFGSTRS